MQKTKELLKDFISAALAGTFIGVGGTAYLTVAAQSKIAGALFFAVGLFSILLFKLNLFTGKVCYACENGKFYFLRLLVIFFGNFVGAFFFAFIINLSRLSALSEVAKSICEAKLSDGLLSVFVLSVLCNVMIYLAVEGFNKSESAVIKLAAVLFGVSVFVICGFEHCVANVFYISLSNMWIGKTFLFLIVNVLGNSAGGILTRVSLKYVASPLNENKVQNDGETEE